MMIALCGQIKILIDFIPIKLKKKKKKRKKKKEKKKIGRAHV